MSETTDNRIIRVYANPLFTLYTKPEVRLAFVYSNFENGNNIVSQISSDTQPGIYSRYLLDAAAAFESGSYEDKVRSVGHTLRDAMFADNFNRFSYSYDILIRFFNENLLMWASHDAGLIDSLYESAYRSYLSSDVYRDIASGDFESFVRLLANSEDCGHEFLAQLNSVLAEWDVSMSEYQKNIWHKFFAYIPRQLYEFIIEEDFLKSVTSEAHETYRKDTFGEELFNEIVEIVIPFCSSGGSKRRLMGSTVNWYFSDNGDRLGSKINYEGSARTFATNMLNTIIENVAQPYRSEGPVVAILNDIIQNVGTDKAKRIQRLVDQIKVLYG